MQKKLEKKIVCLLFGTPFVSCYEKLHLLFITMTGGISIHYVRKGMKQSLQNTQIMYEFHICTLVHFCKISSGKNFETVFYLASKFIVYLSIEVQKISILKNSTQIKYNNARTENIQNLSMDKSFSKYIIVNCCG